MSVDPTAEFAYELEDLNIDFEPVGYAVAKYRWRHRVRRSSRYGNTRRFRSRVAWRIFVWRCSAWVGGGTPGRRCNHKTRRVGRANSLVGGNVGRASRRNLSIRASVTCCPVCDNPPIVALPCPPYINNPLYIASGARASTSYLGPSGPSWLEYTVTSSTSIEPAS